MLIIILALFCFFGAMALLLRKNSHRSERWERAARICPCTRLARTGALSKLLTYSAIAVIFVDGCAAQLVGLDAQKAAELALCVLLLALGWANAKE